LEKEKKMTLLSRPNKFLNFALSITALLLLSACSLSLAEDVTPPPGAQTPVLQEQPTEMTGPFFPVVAPNPTSGASLYAEKCAPCHGDTGMGDGPRAAQLSVPVAAIGDPALARQKTPSEWFQIVSQGNLERFMPPFASLSEPQRWDVVAYVYTLSMGEDVLQTGEILYDENCSRCHGVSGQGDGAVAGSLSTPVSDFTDQARMAEKSSAALFETISKGSGTDMPAFDRAGEGHAQLSEEQRWSLASYLRTLSFTNSADSRVEVNAASEITSTPLAGTIAESAQITSTLASTPSLSGAVTVRLINGSGGEVPAELPVTLYGFDSMQLVYTDTLSSPLGDEVVFNDVPKPAGRAFLAGVDYQNLTIGSDVAVVEDATTPLTLTVTIFETTTDQSDLVVDRMHVFFDFSDPEQVQVVEVFVISNPTNKAVVAAEEGGPVVSFPLPEGATSLQFQDGSLGDRYLETPEGFADTQSVRPGTGEYQVIFAYNVPYKRKLELSLPMSLPVDSAVVMLPEVGVKVKSDQLQAGGEKDVQGTTYLMYSGGGLSPDNPLVMELSGRARGSSTNLLTGAENRTSLLIGLGAFGVTLILVGVWLFRKNHTDGEDEEDEDDEDGNQEVDSGDIPNDPEALMDAIIALDDLYKAGELPEEAYQQRRAALKEKLNRVVGKAT
jgi:mono/diheme cytochrome c family protein